MIDKEINIAIAKRRGWKGIHGSTHSVGYEGYDPVDGVLKAGPDYINSPATLPPTDVSSREMVALEETFCAAAKQLYKRGLTERGLMGLLHIALDEMA